MLSIYERVSNTASQRQFPSTSLLLTLAVVRPSQPILLSRADCWIASEMSELRVRVQGDIVTIALLCSCGNRQDRHVRGKHRERLGERLATGERLRDSIVSVVRRSKVKCSCSKVKCSCSTFVPSAYTSNVSIVSELPMSCFRSQTPKRLIG